MPDALGYLYELAVEADDEAQRLGNQHEVALDLAAEAWEDYYTAERLALSAEV